MTMPVTTTQVREWPQTVEAFEELIDATKDELVNFAAHRLGSGTDAEDVVQEVYVQAFHERQKRRHITDVRPYLFRMVINRCTDLYRRKSRHSAVAVSEARDRCTTTPFSVVSELEEAHRIRNLLAAIPEREADVLRLRAYAELSFAEIASVLGSSVPTVKSRFRYGIERLRRMLREKGETK